MNGLMDFPSKTLELDRERCTIPCDFLTNDVADSATNLIDKAHLASANIKALAQQYHVSNKAD
jgi:hypothetical protein